MIARCVVVVAVLAGCRGDRDAAPGPAQAPGPVAAPGCAAGQLVTDGGCAPALGPERVASLRQQAARLAAVGTLLAGAEVLGQAGEVVASFHGLAAWQRHAAAQPGFAIVDLAPAVRAAPARLAELATQFAVAARHLDELHAELVAIARGPGARTLAEVRALVSTRIATTIAPLGAAITTTIRDTLSPLVSPLVDEVGLLNQRVCPRPDATTRAPCARAAVVSAASAYLEQARSTARQEFDDVGGQLARQLGDLLDGPARAAIDRATGRGPSYGEPCGPDGLCAWRLTCRPATGAATGAATGTCERTCSEAAMQPCPAALRCQTIAGLGSVCRP